MSTTDEFFFCLNDDAVRDVLRTGERILDVGCGDGVLTAELKKRGCRVVGIDFAPDMVAAAVKRVRAIV